jgi:cobalt-zinc-cadmium efflux system outer membrane protein
MYRIRKVGLHLFAALILTGCAARRYQPAPIVATETASRLETRSLADPRLRAFVEKDVGHAVTPWPPQTWDSATLYRAALYFSPALDAARARLAESQAAIVSAGARPNPSLSVTPGVPSPYLFNLDFSVPIETAGKRGHRIQTARSLDEAARFDLADSAWKVRSSVRIALLNYLLAARSLDSLRSEETIRGEQVNILQQRFLIGEIPRPEVDLARIELSKADLAINTVEGQLAEAKAALAASIGIPVAGLRGFEFSWADLDSPPGAESLSPEEIQRDAVLNRLDVRRSLAQYAAAEADLQLEISKQYPDLQIGTGYTYEETNNFFTLGLSTILPLFNRNQGPIAEAEARRKEAAASFLEKQAQVIAGGERALALYKAALKELAEVDQTLSKLQDSQLRMMRQAVRLGEEDRLGLNGVQIQSAVLARARLDALARAQSALGELEDAVQRPLDPGDAFSVTPESPTLSKLSKESNR